MNDNYQFDYKYTLKTYVNSKIEIYKLNDMIHREEDPAYIEWDINTGNCKAVQYHINNKNHSEDGPAIIEWYVDSCYIKREVYKLNENYHRDDGPAFIDYYNINPKDSNPPEYTGKSDIKFEVYLQNDMIHRVNGPAWIEYYPNNIIKTQKYYIDGILCKEVTSAYYDWYGDEGFQIEYMP